MTSVAASLEGSAERFPEKPALIHGDDVITYRDLQDRVARAGAAFHELGVRRGDRVALLLGNTPAFVVALYGALSIGAVVAPLNVLLTGEELGPILADAQATAVVTEPDLLSMVRSVRGRIPSLDHVLVTGSRRAPRGTRSFEASLRTAGDTSPQEVGEEDLAILAYTAGTTADPKGAMLTHRNLLANQEQVAAIPALREMENDVVLLALPLFHIYGLNVGLGITLREGATGVLVERFDPVGTLEAVERHGITVLLGAPPMFAAWLQAAEGRPFDLATVRLAVSGAAPLPGPILEAFRDRLGITIWEGYGLTETAPVVATNAAGTEAKPESIGLPLPGVDVRLIDEDGEEVADGDPGEILVRGPNVFGGYWNREDESAEAFRGGWFRTGDVAYRDDDGYLFIVDRRKDLIIVSGFNVFPREVEEALEAHPKVAEVAVIGVPDARTGEAVKALVVLRPGEDATEEEMLDHCVARLARFKVPRDIELIESLPRHPTGKVLRRRLRGVEG